MDDESQLTGIAVGLPLRQQHSSQVSTKFNTSAPETGQTYSRRILKIAEFNCFLLSCLARSGQSLLILVASRRYDRHKIDYSQNGLFELPAKFLGSSLPSEKPAFVTDVYTARAFGNPVALRSERWGSGHR